MFLEMDAALKYPNRLLQGPLSFWGGHLFISEGPRVQWVKELEEDSGTVGETSSCSNQCA